jgi:hypothetical protein
MSTFRRVFVSIGAPLVVIAGLGILWGVRNASALKTQIEAWADSLEHSPNAVEMKGLTFIPVYVEGNRVGKLDAVVIQRHEPGTVDSINIAVAGTGADLARYEDCHLQLDPDAFDEKGPLGIKNALQCVQDTSEMVRFGTVDFEDLNRKFALFMNDSDLPCEHMSQDSGVDCTQLREEIHRLRDEIRQEVRIRVRNP